MNVNDFIQKVKMAESCKTIYIKGCFGAPMTATNKARYTTNLEYNRKRTSMINACSADYFGFDCVCLIKGILWGWDADKNKTYGGALYKAHDIPDISADQILNYCSGVSTDFSNIIPGEVVWMPGHVGIYVGDGKVIESTPKWLNNVQYSNLGNIGNKIGNWRIWRKHGKLKWIEYSDTPKETKPVEKPKDTATYYTIVKGDTLSKIGKKFGIKWQLIAELNGIKFPYIIKTGQKIRIK